MRNHACCSGLNIGARRILALLGIAVCVAIGFSSATMRAANANESVIHSFTGSPSDGAYPAAGLTLGRDGSLYGTTAGGAYDNCSYGCGTVFKLTPAGGGWSETVLYSFQGDPDGANPYGSGVIFGPDGSLYGTTNEGGVYNQGTVFRLTPNGSGWSETVLHSFQGSPDGAYPYAGVIFGPDRALYGTTYAGGTSGYCPDNGGSTGCGTVFKLIPNGAGSYEAVLYSFKGSPDGAGPYGSGVTIGPDGALYGTTEDGGTSNYGTVFKVGRQGGTETVLHSFQGSPDGEYPAAGVTFGPDGALYSTTYSGGTYDYGTVFKLTPAFSSGWPETVLYSFKGSPDGEFPYAGVIFGPNGALYGTTYYGGAYDNCSSGCGTVYKLTPVYSNWRESVLYSFQGDLDGYGPYLAGVIFGPGGALYGTTFYGGISNEGTAFQVHP